MPRRSPAGALFKAIVNPPQGNAALNNMNINFDPGTKQEEATQESAEQVTEQATEGSEGTGALAE